MAWAITAAVVMGGLTANSISEQNKAAQKQQEEINSAAAISYQLAQQQEQEVKAQAGIDLTNEAIKANTERGRMRAAQSESGVAGLSPLRELGNTYVQESMVNGTIISKEQAQQRSIALSSLSNFTQFRSQGNQAESQKTTGFEAALQVGLAAAGGYYGGTAFTAPAGSVASTQALTKSQLLIGASSSTRRR